MHQSSRFVLATLFSLCQCRWLVASVILVALSGCQSYNWRTDLPAYKAAEQQARQEGKHLFIFYKWWLDSSSNRMLDREVLSDPEVTALFQDTLNLLVEKAGGAEYETYMAKFGVSSTPASIIVAPDGKFRKRIGFVPKEQFIEFVKSAKSSLSTQPERPGPAVP